jgi:hypothetical protein
MTKKLVIFACLLLLGIAGIIVICSVPMQNFIAATIRIFSGMSVITGGIGLLEILDDSSHDDDNDGPHFYGPGGTII